MSPVIFDTGSLSRTVADNIRQLLFERKMSVRELSRIVTDGKNETWASGRLNGTTAISLDDLELIAQAMRLPMSTLMGISTGASVRGELHDLNEVLVDERLPRQVADSILGTIGHLVQMGIFAIIKNPPVPKEPQMTTRKVRRRSGRG